MRCRCQWAVLTISSLWGMQQIEANGSSQFWGSSSRASLLHHSLGLYQNKLQSQSALDKLRGGADSETANVSKKKKKAKRPKTTAAEESSETDGSNECPAFEDLVEKKPKVIKPIVQQKKQKVSKAARAHMQATIKSTSPNFRIQRELKAFLSDPPPGLTVQVGKNLRVWIVTIQGPGIYEGETFRLRIAFPSQYPTVPPSVFFLQPNLPVGPHFYTNGDICLSLLGKDWRPTMTAQSIALSILSMLASTQKKVMPMDNAAHAQNKPGQYQKDWVYHDDNC